MEAYYAFSDEAGQYENTCGKRFLKSHPYYVRATLLVKIEEFKKVIMVRRITSTSMR